MKHSRKAQTSQLMSIFVPMLVISIIAVAFAIVVSDMGQNYNVSYDDTSYQAIIAQSGNISAVTDSTTEAVVGDNEDRSNVLTSTERLVTGAYNAILSLANVPGIYLAIITVVADVIGIPLAIINLVMAGILFAIVAVIIYLALGRI